MAEWLVEREVDEVVMEAHTMIRGRGLKADPARLGAALCPMSVDGFQDVLHVVAERHEETCEAIERR